MPTATQDETEGAEPRTLGRYRLLREVGSGGQARVWLAEDMQLKRKVALKVLNADRAISGRHVARFQREAELASKLDHPVICTVYEAGEHEGVPFLAMRFVDGESLAERVVARRALLDAKGPDSAPGTDRWIDENVALVEKVARALHVAHEAGLLHRDVKPGNVMVTRGGEPVVLDFGLARDDDSDVQLLTRTGEFMGTPAYMAPEQLSSRGTPPDRRADVYSLAATLYECLTLRRAFEATALEVLYRRILTDDAPDPRKLQPRVSLDLQRVLEKALEKDPERRYPSALAFAEDLRRVRAHEPILAARTGVVRRARKWARRNPAVAAALAALVLVVLASGATLVGVQGFGRAANGGGEAAVSLANAMGELRDAVPEGPFRAGDALRLRSTFDQLATELDEEDADDLRRYLVGLLMERTREFPNQRNALWRDGPRAQDGEVLWTLISQLEPAQVLRFRTRPTRLAELPEGAVVVDLNDVVAQQKAAADGAGEWYTFATADYAFNTNAADPAIAEQVARQLQLVRRQAYERLLPSAESGERAYAVRIFVDAEQYGDFGGEPGTSAHWSPERRELFVLAPTGDGADQQLERQRVALFHEGFHQYVGAGGEREVPRWADERLAELFASAAVEDGRVQVDARALAAPDLPAAPAAPDPPDLRMSGALLYFLNEVAENERWKDIPARYLECALAGREEDEALRTSCEGVDVAELKSAFHTWLQKQTPSGQQP